MNIKLKKIGYDTLQDIVYASPPLLSSQIRGFRTPLKNYSYKLENNLCKRAFRICITLWVKLWNKVPKTFDEVEKYMFFKHICLPKFSIV